jgi:hypothetical protein
LIYVSGIIAIHATDGYGNPCDINSTTDYPESFATLGKDIESMWKPDKCRSKQVFVTGSSFATPVAAAIAADVLEYARWNLNLTIEEKKRLYSWPYMKKIFAKMAGDNPRGGYGYVQPWTLWEKGYKHVKDVKDVLRLIITDLLV